MVDDVDIQKRRRSLREATVEMERAARERETISYGDLVTCVTALSLTPNSSALERILSKASTQTQKERGVLLSIVVVNRETSLPAGTRIRQQVAELERKIKAQVVALEEGVEPELVSERIGELRAQKEALEDALSGLGADQVEAEDEELVRRLAAVPDLSESLRTASPQIKRQVFEAFDLQIAVDKTEGRVEISATVSEEVAKALNTKDPLAREGLAVVPKDIAGAGFEGTTAA